MNFERKGNDFHPIIFMHDLEILKFRNFESNIHATHLKI